MQLPHPIRTYFEAQAPQDADAFMAAFSPDAMVRDERRTHQGRTEIRDWWQAAKEAYRHKAEPQELTRIEGKTVVRALVSGDFPGSPAMLTFTFGLAGDQITDLEIH